MQRTISAGGRRVADIIHTLKSGVLGPQAKHPSQRAPRSSWASISSIRLARVSGFFAV